MKNVDTSLGEAPSIAERLRWGGSHGTALFFLLTVSTFPRHRCGGRCSSCRGQRMPLSLRDCRSAHHQNILSCAGMLSCTFPEIQHCSLHKPSKENPIVTLRQFFQFLHKWIRITRAGRCQVLDKFFTNKFEKKQKNKPYKAFSRYRTDLSLVGLNSLLYMFFLRPPAERCFPSLSWIPLLSFQHLPLLLQLSHGLLAVFQQIKLLKNNSSRKKSL